VVILPQSDASGPPDQAIERVEAWIRERAAPGDPVVVLFEQRNLREYRLDEIEGLDRRRRHLRLAQHGSFHLTGLARRVPPGIVMRILIPSAEILRAAIEANIWIDGRPVFKRPLTEREKAIAHRIGQVGWTNETLG
jgi:hypothetical protein